MKCPACKEVTLVISERQGIEIDYCPECRGVWLDRGELDKLIERAERPATAERPHTGDVEHRDRRHPDDSHYYGKRRKSFLHELFD